MPVGFGRLFSAFILQLITAYASLLSVKYSCGPHMCEKFGSSYLGFWISSSNLQCLWQYPVFILY